MRRIWMAMLVSLCLVGSIEAASVGGYSRRDGTYVQPYERTDPNAYRQDNYGFPGNTNPNTFRVSPGNRPRALQQELWGNAAPTNPRPNRGLWGR